MRVMELKRKVVLLGDSGVGKTSLVRRFVYDMFSEDYIQTIGTKVSKKNTIVQFEGEKYRISLVIWDVLGQQGYSNVQSAAFRGSDGALFVCDISRKDTLHGILHYWMPTLESVAGVPGILLVNKDDLSDKKIGEDEIIEFSRITGLPYLRTSAKNGDNVEKAFSNLAELMLLFRPVRVSMEDEKEITTPKDAMDTIMTDFCKQYGNWNDGMAILEANIRVIGINMKKPQRHELYLLIEKLYRIDTYNIGIENAQKNRVRRLGFLESIKS